MAGTGSPLPAPTFPESAKVGGQEEEVGPNTFLSKNQRQNCGPCAKSSVSPVFVWPMNKERF